MQQQANTRCQTIPDLLMRNLAEHGARTALRSREADGSYRSMSFIEYADQVARCAAGLSELGFGPGQRLLLMLRNRPEFHVLDLAATFLGGTPVSIYNSSPPPQIQYLLDHSEATVAIADDLEFLERFQAAGLSRRTQLGVLGTVVPKGVFGFESLLDHAPIDLERAAQDVHPGMLATLIYTSGTTGAPKAVMHTHRNIIWACESMQTLLDEHPRFRHHMEGTRVISYLPMAHIAERQSSHYMALISGTEVTCCPELTQLSMYLREVRPHMFVGVPRVWEKLYAGVQAAIAAVPERAQKMREAVAAATELQEKQRLGTANDQDMATLRFLDEVAFNNVREQLGFDETILALTGAAPLTLELQQWFRAIGVPLSDCYGMSECCGPMTWTPFAAKPGTVGKAIPGLEVKLADDGEILCRGGNVFEGYLSDPAQTQATIDTDGWLHSGDIGQLDDEGYFRVVDRKKELLITAGGDNVSPANLEAALKTIALVGQACAVGDKRPYLSALLVLDPDVTHAWAQQRGLGDAPLSALAQHPELVSEVSADLERVMSAFGRVERIKRFAILDVEWLPDSEELTPTGKLKRRAILTKYKAEIDALYLG